MPSHDFSGRLRAGPCLWCGLTADKAAAGDCRKHPRTATGRAIPPSGLEDFDFLNKRVAELAAERAAAQAAKSEE